MINMTWTQYVKGQCTYKHKKILLSRGERDLLLILLLKRGVYVSFAEVIEALWPDQDRCPKSPKDVFISRLNKLKDKLPGAIVTPLNDYITIDAPVSKIERKYKTSRYPVYHQKKYAR